MKGHISDRFPDYLEGRLSPEERADVDVHLRECGSCAEDLRWARELRDEALRNGAMHLSPERIVELSEGHGVPVSDAEAAHLGSCTACAREAEWVGSLPGSVEKILAPMEERAAGKRRRVVPIRIAAWGGAIAAALALLFLLPRNGDDIRDLAQFEPLGVRFNRGATSGSSFDENRLSGLESYANGDWQAARTALLRAHEERPGEEEIVLYLGSAEILTGDRPAGAERLRALAESSDDPALRDEASWILANVALAAGRTDEAESRLQPLASGDGHRAGEARALREEIRARR